MKRKQQYKIDPLQDILNGFKPPRIGLVNFLRAMVESSKKSKVNFFLQFTNFLVIFLLILVILPDRSNQWLSSMNELQLLFLPLGRIAHTIIFYIMAQTILGLSVFSWASIFETGFRITILISIGLIVCVLVLFNNLITIFKDRLRQDFILWQTNQ